GAERRDRLGRAFDGPHPGAGSGERQTEGPEAGEELGDARSRPGLGEDEVAERGLARFGRLEEGAGRNLDGDAAEAGADGCAERDRLGRAVADTPGDARDVRRRREGGERSAGG